MRASRYWILAERDNEAGRWDIAAGFTSRNEVDFERQTYRDRGTPAKRLKVISLPNDLQATIDKAIRDLNQ